MKIQIDVLRGTAVESSHEVDAVVIDRHRKVLAEYGNAERPVFTRSVIKPLQAIPFIISESYLKTPEPMKAVSIACGSHEAEETHLECLNNWLATTRLTEESLICGPAKSHTLTGKRKLFNNCSGKHLAMLCTCETRGFSTSDYFKWSHPIQSEIRNILTHVSGIDVDKTAWGIDGCGLPTYLMPIKNVALAMSALLGESADLTDEFRSAVNVLHKAWASEPWMVSGHNEIDSEVINATRAKTFTKIGAEGNHVAVLFDEGIVISLKARDGNFRASEAALALLLERYADRENPAREITRALAWPAVKNAAGDTVGEIQAKFI